ncbi:hypothetical protein [Heyndrickxia sporothermodurans]|nr:hypothetical protein [Heyndrickxia sporothermodurans]
MLKSSSQLLYSWYPNGKGSGKSSGQSYSISYFNRKINTKPGWV